ncbi:hypothetical protein NIES2101_30720 [Calothrix sp. HK-06]|nr:hypothetical protein NIES2101_30720 [Calothrix sp. HK-06]
MLSFAIKEPKQPKQDIASIRQVDKHIRETEKFITDKYWRLVTLLVVKRVYQYLYSAKIGF